MAATKQLPEVRSKIDARNAARAAAEYFRELYPTTQSFSLEEVELSDDGKHWLVTLSFEVPLVPPSVHRPSIAGFFGPPKTKFKVFKVDAKTGQVLAMRIRKIE